MKRSLSTTTSEAQPVSKRLAAQKQVAYDQRKNDDFAFYYGEQLGMSDLDSFLAVLKTPAPMTLRVTATKPLQTQVMVVKNLQRLGLQPLQWANALLPHRPTEQIADVVWSCSHDIYHEHKELYDFTRSQKVAGNLYFQESVSMLPVLILGIRAHHCIADLCAAPGSKTTLCLDVMNRQCLDGNYPCGFVLANEFDAKRAKCLLANKLRLSAVPTAIVTICSAQNLPCGENYFDRVLADVPCSGDGTIRKDPTIWSRWLPRDGLEMHMTQLRILKRALKLVKKGGFCVYSTCSFNPIECEAVVAAALLGTRAEQDAQGNAESLDEYEVVPIKEELFSAGLTVSAGLKSWRVPNILGEDEERTHQFPGVDEKGGCGGDAGGDDARKEQGGFANQGRKMKNGFYRFSRAWDRSFLISAEDNAKLPRGIKRSMFPCSGKFARLNDQLENCARLYPHENGCGGFFVALIRRREDIVPSFLESGTAIVEHDSIDSQTSESLGCDWASIREFYGVETPSSLGSHHITKSGRKFVITSSLLSRFIESETNRILPRHRAKLTVHSFGLAVLKNLSNSALRVAQDSCRWRPTQEGVSYLAKHCMKRKIFMSASALSELIAKREMDEALLRFLEEKGEVAGLHDIICKTSLLPGGVLVGLISNSLEEEIHGIYKDWCWVACVATSRSILVYAPDTALWHISSALGRFRKQDEEREEGGSKAATPKVNE